MLLNFLMRNHWMTTLMLSSTRPIDERVHDVETSGPSLASTSAETMRVQISFPIS